MKRTALAFCFVALAYPVVAQDAECVIGDVIFTTHGGVLALYDGPRGGRSLNTSNLLVADMMSCDADRMRFALDVDGGQIAAKGFGKDTAITGLTCTEYE